MTGNNFNEVFGPLFQDYQCIEIESWSEHGGTSYQLHFESMTNPELFSAQISVSEEFFKTLTPKSINWYDDSVTDLSTVVEAKGPDLKKADEQVQ